MLLDDPGHESLDLGEATNCLVREASLNEGNYFSKAVEKPSSPEKGPHSVIRRKSQVQGLPRSRQSPVEDGSLELGVTPRLKRTMSNLPFRPPFKEL